MFSDIRYAVRSLLNNPGFSLVAVLALAIGIGANTAIFTVVNAVLLRPLPFGEPDRLYRIAAAPQNRPDAVINMADPAVLSLQKETTTFEAIGSYNGGMKSLTGLGEPLEVLAPEVTANFMSLLRVEPQLGRTFLPSEGLKGNALVTILSDRFWQSRFHGDTKVIGRSLVLDGMPYVVVGVMPPSFRLPEEVDLWVPAVLDPTNLHIAFRSVVGRLRAGVARGQAQAELDALARRMNKQDQNYLRKAMLRLHPLRETVVGGKISKQLGVLLGAVAFLLLIACVNVANLLLARSTRRQQEVAVRYSLGATRPRLVRLLLTESAILSLAAGFAGVFVAVWGVATLLRIAPVKSIPRFDEINLDPRVFLFTFGLSIITCILFGLWPALHASKINLNETLKQSFGRLTARSQAVRSALVVAEIALALVLLVGAGLLIKSFIRLRSVDPGFRSQGLISMVVRLPETYKSPQAILGFGDRTMERIKAIPGVDSAAMVNFLPMRWDLVMGTFGVEGRAEPTAGFNVTKPAVTPGYFRTMGIRVLKGRDFTAADTVSAPGVMIVGQATAKRVWPNEDPIGKRITFADHPAAEDWYTVIGVVDDVKQEDLKDASPPAIYQPISQVQVMFFLQSLNFVARTSTPAAAIASSMRAALRQVDPNQPVFDISTMEDLLTTNTAEPRFYSRLLGTFSFVALLLAVLGIYGVMAFTVVQRTREIGIRLALGAQSEHILASVLKRSAMMAGFGIALGVGGALAVTRVLKAFLFEVEPTDPSTFLIISILLAAAAMLASYLPARRASRIDPINALRYE